MESIKRLRLSEEAIQGLLHPHSGAPIEPVGFRKDGRAIWPILGASEDDDTDEDDDDDDSGGDDDDADKKKKSSASDDDDDADEDDDDDKPASKELEAKNRQLIEEKRKQRDRADRLNQELESTKKRLKDLESKDLPEAEKLQKDLEETTEANSKLTKQNYDLALQVAFLQDNSFEWHNPAHALKSTDLSDVSINEDGTVSGLADALKKTAEDYPYLLKENAGDDDGKPTPKKTPGAPKNKNDDKASRRKQELEEKYPGLRR